MIQLVTDCHLDVVPGSRAIHPYITAKIKVADDPGVGQAARTSYAAIPVELAQWSEARAHLF